MKFYTVFAGMLLFSVSCSNNSDKPGGDKQPELSAKKDTLEAPAYKIPQKVTGAFLGSLPCKDCKKLDRFVVIQEGYYEINEHHQGTTDKNKLLVRLKGKCEQDSGIIALYDTKDKLFQSYKIVGMDSIQLVQKGKVGAPVYFIRKDGKKLAQ